MLAGAIALLVAGLFTGAAFYINFAEQPARLRLDDPALLIQWKFAYQRGVAMQGTLVVIGFLLGVLAWYQTRQVAFLVGAILPIANWPWTILVIMKVNQQLEAIPPDEAGPAARALIRKWNVLHAVRTVLGSLSALAFLLSLVWR